VRRLPVAAFVALAAATVAAFFVTQHLKVTTPLLAGFPAPAPPAINPVDGHVCRGVSHRSMFVSFYLLHRSDDVDVYIVDPAGNVIDTIGSDVVMQAGSHPKRKKFFWNGRNEDGAVVPDGPYYIKVALIHQGRSVLISNNAGPEPVTVRTKPPHLRITAVRPALLPRAGVAGATITYRGNQHRLGWVLVYRTDLPGGPRLVATFASRRNGVSVWDGRIQGRPAPQGTYLIGLRVADAACNTARFPAQFPPVPASTRGAGLTVRYLAAQPPNDPVGAGRSAEALVDARGNAFHWTLRRAGSSRRLDSGSTRGYSLAVHLAAGHAGLYELELRYGAHRTAVPLVASAGMSNQPGAAGTGGAPSTATARPRVLVVLPALTWQGRNPVDDDHDGLPNMLAAGTPILLARPLADGLPAGWPDLTGVVSYLQRHHLGYELTTDLALAEGSGPALRDFPGVILAGDELWTPPALAAGLRSYVQRGGRLLSLGLDSLRRGVTLTATQALHPTAARSADIFGVRVGPLARARGALIVAGTDKLGLFRGTSGVWRYRAYEPFTGVIPPATLASSAGVASGRSAVIGLRLGVGMVIEVGLPGFGARLAGDPNSQQLFSRLYRVLARGHS
jgi:hypothetical protein